MSGIKDLVIILPIYNPPSDWVKSLSVHIKGLRKLLNVDYSVVLVDDGSAIDMIQEANELTREYEEFHFVSYEVNKGKGHALRVGVAQFEANNYILTDFDLPFGFSSIKDFSDHLESNIADVYLGQRTKAYFKALPIKRRILSRLFNYFTMPFLGFKQYDTQTGIKGFNQNGKRVFLETMTNSYVYDFEFVRLAVKACIHIQNIEVTPIESITFSNFGTKTMVKELKSLMRVLFN